MTLSNSLTCDFLLAYGLIVMKFDIVAEDLILSKSIPLLGQCCTICDCGIKEGLFVVMEKFSLKRFMKTDPKLWISYFVQK